MIKSQADIEYAISELRRAVPEFGLAYDLCAPINLRRKPAGFETLLNAIVGQQVSVASASAIWKRLENVDFISRENVRACTEQDLADAGLSRPKIRYAKALATSDLDFTRLDHLNDQDVILELTKILGIGTWTAEVYALAALGREDIFPHGDLALQEATKHLFQLEQRPNEKRMKEIASDWSPWRAVAARVLWAYYRHIKDREGIS